MLCWGNVHIMKWRQLFWITFCVVRLSGTTTDSPTDSSTTVSLAMTTAQSDAGSMAPASTMGSAATTPDNPGNHCVGNQIYSVHGIIQLHILDDTHRSNGSLTQALLSDFQTISCRNIKEVNDSGALCLRLNESHTCKHFLDTKGSELWSAICKEDARRVPATCQIELATSEVDQECLLLVLVGNTDPAPDVLQKSHWEKFGIKSLERGSVRSHQDFSRKTLTALVTSGLLLAALGMAGYFLMRRRSWSPAGQRLVSAYRWQSAR
ncbi:hypothetical protein ASZ78_015782 [Callipepla squamata]|uniref:Hematopoietic progenitor cell antigen CD34 n=1 Tax=Callipepla squamata TaxID=9009 RepID=A0A226NHY5_CALSU|nr:hypothetical protein ASZ78_015782 [Callipepla squamata]